MAIQLYKAFFISYVPIYFDLILYNCLLLRPGSFMRNEDEDSLKR
jgi:hypothetical protein